MNESRKGKTPSNCCSAFFPGCFDDGVGYPQLDAKDFKRGRKQVKRWNVK